MDEIPHLFKLAKNVSTHSDYKIKMGAVLVKKSHPISVGFNKIKYNRIFSHPEKMTIHAEMSAIQSSGKENIKGSSMFIYRENRKGNLAMARPCENCMEKLRQYGIKKIYYTTNEFPFWEMEKI